MKKVISVYCALLTALASLPPSVARAEDSGRFSARFNDTPSLAGALPTAFAQDPSTEKERKAGLLKILVGCGAAGVGGILMATSTTTITFVNGQQTDTERSGGFWGGIALAGGGAALIVFGARQRINAFEPAVAVPLGKGDHSSLVLSVGRRPSVGYRWGW